jgi:hypothetical protein
MKNWWEDDLGWPPARPEEWHGQHEKGYDEACSICAYSKPPVCKMGHPLVERNWQNTPTCYYGHKEYEPHNV